MAAASASHRTTGPRDVTPSRVAAAAIMADLRNGELLDASFARRTAQLDSRDRRWVQELTWGTLRRRSLLDGVIETRVVGGLARLDSDVRDLLEMGVYQLFHMNSVPPYAAIAQTVELVKERHGKGAAGLTNAVLRRIDRERPDPVAAALAAGPADPVDQIARLHSHPRWLVARWVARWGEHETRTLLEVNNREAPMVLRPFGRVREQVEAALDEAGVRTRDVPLVPDSLEVEGGTHVSLTGLGAFRQGFVFVQDPAATLVARYAAVDSGSTVVDLCAAPGGKAIELSRQAERVIAIDRSPSRMERLRDNVSRLAVSNIELVIGDARESPIEPGVDAVLIDAPCTGTGTFRRHPDARWRLRVSDLAVLSSTQRMILRRAAGLVRPGGLLVYSTCSLEPEENDDQIELFLRENPGWVLELPPPGAVPAEVLDAGRLRVLPQRHGVDGAFAARIRRPAVAS
ncbi:MAG: 16S rRNA (cytosine(967)-C(5))-methyltransferase RsmB [Gemmatimonadota bacterium]